jgi:DNA-binding MarR family transcriptional regulator
MRSQDILSLADFLPYQISILSNRVSSTIASAYQDKFALSVTQWRIMAVLGEAAGEHERGVSGDTVSQRTQVEKSLISRAMKQLIARNLVRRETDVSDARKHCLRLSKTGAEIYRQVVPLSKAYEQELFDCLSDEELSSFKSLIKKVSDSIEQVSAKDLT